MQYVNLVKILVLLTFVHMLYKFDKRQPVHRWVLAILTLNLVNETLSSVFRYLGIELRFSNSIYIILHTMLWMGLIGRISGRMKLTSNLTLGYLLFAVINLMWIDGLRAFNVYSLVLGGLIYVGVYIYDCYVRLRDEDLNYFSSNEYLLTAAPLLFMIGFGVLFGFRNKSLHETQVLGMTLFKAVGYFINIVYYGLVNYYIFTIKRDRSGA